MSRKTLTSIIFAITALIIISMLLSNTQSEGSGNYPYNGLGDWEIENETIVKNEAFELNGSLVIKNNGNLQLYNVSIDINTTNEYILIVEEGGKFHLNESNVIPLNSSNPNKIEIKGDMTIENSFVGGLADNIPPENPILDLINPSTLKNNGKIEISGTVSDNKGVKRIEVFNSVIKENIEYKEKVGTINFKNVIKTRAFQTEIQLNSGTNYISVKAIDSSGNVGAESDIQKINRIGGPAKEDVTIEESSLVLNIKAIPDDYDYISIEKNIELNLPDNVIYHDISWKVDSGNPFDSIVKAYYETTHLYGMEDEDLMIIMSSKKTDWTVITTTLNKEEKYLSFNHHFDNPTYFGIVSGIPDLNVIDIKLNRDPLPKGKILEVTATIENFGKYVKNIDDEIKVEFVAMELSSEKRNHIKTVHISGGFEANSVKDITVSWEEVDKEGLFEIIVIVDPLHEIYEQKLDNNRKTVQIEVIDIGNSDNANEIKEDKLELTPEIIVLSTVTSGIIGLAWIKRFGILIPLYSRIKKSEVLDNKLRERIHNRILTNPGENLGTIKNKLHLNNGAVIHHLTRLEKEGFIKSQRDGMYRRFYPNGTRLPDVVEIQEEIRRAIQRNEGITQSEIAIKIGVSRQVVNYHVKLMIKNGTVRLQKNGRESKCFLGSN